MKRLIFLAVLFLLLKNASAQNRYFEMPLYFEDGAGNRDTLSVGYSDTISFNDCAGPFLYPEYGETNEAAIPWDNDFEVRANKTFLCVLDFFEILGHKSITSMEGDCDEPLGGQGGTIFLIARVKHLPLTISWDTSLLNTENNYCRNGSLIDRTPFSSQYPDVEFPEKAVARMNDTDHLVDSFHLNIETGNPEEIPTWTTIRKIGNTLDTFRIYELHFGNNWWLPEPVKTKDLHELPLTLYPNPTHNEILISEISATRFVSVTIYDLAGSIIHTQKLDGNTYTPIPLTGLSPGFYSLIAQTEKGEHMKGRFIKL